MFSFDARDRYSDVPRGAIWPPAEGPRVAALDVGSNSFHLMVAELGEGGRFSAVERLKEKVRLGESVFATGAISEPAFERGLGVLERMAAKLQHHAPEAVLAVATSALREADNGVEFVRCARRLTGLPIRIIDGLEEARLMLLGTRRELALDGARVALFDIGGGSTEIVLADDTRCLFTASLALGTLRMRAGSPCAQGPLDADGLWRMEESVLGTLSPTLRHVREVGFDRVVLSCGVARRLWRFAVAQEIGGAGSDGGLARLELATLAQIVRRLAPLDRRERLSIQATEDGGDTLLPGAIALGVLLEGLAVRHALVAQSGLREGLLADYLRETGRV